MQRFFLISYAISLILISHISYSHANYKKNDLERCTTRKAAKLIEAGKLTGNRFTPHYDNCDCGRELIDVLPKRTSFSYRIVSSSFVQPLHRYPWMVQVRVGGEQWGAGAIITPNYVITAAHVAKNVLVADAYSADNEVSLKSATVAVASQSKNTQFVTFRIHEVKIHPKFEVIAERPVYDVALLKLKDSIIFSDRVRPICLSMKPFFERPGGVAMVIGWGVMNKGGNTTRRLKEAMVPIRSSIECAKILRKQMYALGSYSICAGGYPEEDACEGDSGGPLQIKDDCGRWNLLGLVSWGVGCGEHIPGVYARMSKFIQWVLNNTMDSMSCDAANVPRIEPNLKECGLPAYRYMKTGIPVKILEIPWLADIYHGSTFLGTGVLVNDTMILTTTSVIDPWGISMKFLQLKVHFGYASANKNASDYLFEKATVKQVIFHAFADHRFNLCLLQLGLPMTDSLMKFHPICFSHFKFLNEVEDEILIAAYIGGNYHSYKYATGHIRKLSSCNSGGFHENRSLCVSQFSQNYVPVPSDSRLDQNCELEKGAVVMAFVAGRYYLIGLSSITETCRSPRILYDVNWAVPWITSISTMLDVA